MSIFVSFLLLLDVTDIVDGLLVSNYIKKAFIAALFISLSEIYISVFTTNILTSVHYEGDHSYFYDS